MLDDEEDYNADPKGSSSDIEEEKPVKAAPSEVKGPSGFKISDVIIPKPALQRKANPERTFIDPRAGEALLGKKRKTVSDAELEDYSDDEPSWMKKEVKKPRNMHTGVLAATMEKTIHQ